VRGGCPSNIILMDALTPKTLGALIALYEHMAYVQAVVWDIDAFDQWGVEWGKKLAKEILHNLEEPGFSADYDSSTLGILERYKIKERQ
jgi:glucose-6-phosphate isomerase